MTTIEIIFTYGVGPVITIIGTWVAFKTKQKKDAEKAELVARKSELENVEKAIKIWSDIAERLETKLAQRDQEVHELKLQLNAVLEKLTQIEKDYSRLVRTHAELKKELSK